MSSAVAGQLVLLSHPPGKGAVVVGAGAGNEGGAEASLDTVPYVFTLSGLFLEFAEIFFAPLRKSQYIREKL